jgi:ferric-dicitrate binding protein FerR (iron transport regulator)
MDKQEINKWSRKYIDGQLTDQEKASFEEWYLKQGEVPVETPLEKVREFGETILKELPGNTARPFKRSAILAAAAIVMVMLSIMLELVFHKHSRDAVQIQADISPGGNRAVLTLASGEKIDLAHARSGRIAVQQGSRILKNAAGQLVYQNNELSRDGEPPAENTIATPVGGIWTLSLPDGTKVWLNNSSALTYPVSFRGQKRREVSLEGEAYFEVAKNKAQPFIVKSRNQQVRVFQHPCICRRAVDAYHASGGKRDGK